jgi:uncharacterized membrane protein YhaH (DUF805 family)
MNLVFLVLECVTKKYVTFSGRAKRIEYWLYYLFYVVSFTCFLGLDVLLDTVIEFDDGSIGGVFSAIIILFLTPPFLSVHIRRLHDINKSGYWWFILFVPLIGIFWSIILSCLSGTKGANDFGSDEGNPDITSKQQRLEGFVKRLERLEKN